MNAGLVIVATDTIGQRGIMAQVPDVGLLCRMKDPQTLAKVIDSLIADHVRLSDAQRASKSAAETRFNWGNESTKLIHLVHSGS